jgi:hypothetical protein
MRLPIWGLHAIAAGYSLLFFAAALGKADSWRTWRAVLDNLFPRLGVLGLPLSLAVPVAEAIVGILLVSSPKLGLYGAAVLLAIFALVVVLQTKEHAGRNCSCFGALAPSMISTTLALRDLGLAVAAALVVLLAHDTAAGAFTGYEILVTFLLGLFVLLTGESFKLRRAASVVRNNEEAMSSD